ncbi:SICA antigen [Plasmodium coatneyi]|uniref:SICA antigen n=1 Tax=Plasmodium coatneyi TaxID=208452 RepID=A0A1B1DY75_9APIC|nr:SICA antigen [Plasmodium coatneyi]ANQ07742.1 SICA antigen [Plasmodium coatneyi]
MNIKRAKCMFEGNSAVWVDFPDILEKLSKAITDESTDDDGLCEGIAKKSSGKKDANKKACQLIVKGLTHIYGIDLSHDEKDQQNPFLNQWFQQTMACLLLNAFAKQMEDKCPNTKDSIKQAFGFMNQIKGKKCEKTYPCVPCQREENYEGCKVGEQNLGIKLKELFENNSKNSEIEQTLEDICKQNAKAQSKSPETITNQEQLPDETETSEDPNSKGSGEDTSLNGPEAPAPQPNDQETALAGPAAPAQLSHRINHAKLTSYLPLAPAVLGISIMSYLLWKYFSLVGKSRKRYRRAYQARGPTVQEQTLAHVDDQANGPHAYTLGKERKPRSARTRRKKRAVRRRMIIDIHLEVLDECQKGDLHSTKEDFFEIIVEEFMGLGFREEDFVPKEHVQSSDSGFRV